MKTRYNNLFEESASQNIIQVVSEWHIILNGETRYSNRTEHIIYKFYLTIIYIYMYINYI